MLVKETGHVANLRDKIYSLFLKIGTTLANFQSNGTVSWLIDLCTID